MAHRRAFSTLAIPDHPRFAGFGRFAEREIRPWLVKQDAARRKTVRLMIKIGAGTAAGAAILMLLAFTVFGMHPGAALIVCGGVPLFFGGSAIWFVAFAFRTKLKGFLLPKVCEQLKLRHVGASPAFPISAFDAAGLFPRHDRRLLEDGMEGDERGMPFAVAEARISRRRPASKSGSTNYKMVWRGLVIACAAPRPFRGLTLIMPERGFVDRLFGSAPAERITLGLPDLEAGLEIRTTDRQEARMVLVERVMRRLAELGRRLGRERPSLALAGEHVLLAVPSRADRSRAVRCSRRSTIRAGSKSCWRRSRWCWPWRANLRMPCAWGGRAPDAGRQPKRRTCGKAAEIKAIVRGGRRHRGLTPRRPFPYFAARFWPGSHRPLPCYA